RRICGPSWNRSDEEDRQPSDSHPRDLLNKDVPLQSPPFLGMESSFWRCRRFDDKIFFRQINPHAFFTSGLGSVDIGTAAGVPNLGQVVANGALQQVSAMDIEAK